MSGDNRDSKDERWRTRERFRINFKPEFLQNTSLGYWIKGVLKPYVNKMHEEYSTR
jgi:hypothetical protein